VSVWKWTQSPALLASKLFSHEGNAMRTILIGLAIGLVVIIGGFVALLGLADANAPQAEEIRVEVSDALLD
jgi:hypothetical protein